VHLSPAEERAVARLIAYLIHVLPWQWWIGIGGAGVCAFVAYAVSQGLSTGPAAPALTAAPDEPGEPQDAVPPNWMEDE
jgi:hypothetical protein